MRPFRGYSVANYPTRFRDSTGHCSGNPDDPENPDYGCWQKADEVREKYGVDIDDPGSEYWTLGILSFVFNTLKRYVGLIGETLWGEAFFGKTSMKIGGLPPGYLGQWDKGSVRIDPAVLRDANLTQEGMTGFLAHELTHGLVRYLEKKGENPVEDYATFVGWGEVWTLPNWEVYRWKNPGTGPSNYARTTIFPEEDFCDSMREVAVNGYLTTNRAAWFTEFLSGRSTVPYTIHTGYRP